jgi:hypothetical protein
MLQPRGPSTSMSPDVSAPASSASMT